MGEIIVLQEKHQTLKSILQDLESVIVAFSGGVDSTLLLKVAIDVLGKENVLAITTDSESYPSSELRDASAIAKAIGAEHIVLETSELAIPGYKENDQNRCYFCKSGLFNELKPYLKSHNKKHIVFGLIADDVSEHRPGMKAAKEHGVRAPLQEANLYKEDIRELSKKLELVTWNKPSYACLSSRIAYGEEITQEKLTKVEKAEEFIKQLGVRQVRVRTHENIARIEVEPEMIDKVLKNREIIAKTLQVYGYTYVALDLDGYNSGSMNKSIGK